MATNYAFSEFEDCCDVALRKNNKTAVLPLTLFNTNEKTR